MEEKVEKNNKFENSSDDLFEKSLPAINVDKTNDIKINYHKLERLMENVEYMRMQIDELKAEKNMKEQVDFNTSKCDKRVTPIILENNIVKYTRIAKVVAKVIEILADGVIVIIKGTNESSNMKLTSANKYKDLNLASKKLDISGILKSAEGLISGLTNSINK